MRNSKGTDSKTNLVIFILAIGLFVVGTVELGFAGILKVVSSDLGISIAATGQLVTIYAIIYAIGTPVFTLITSRIERKKLLLLSLIVFILSNVIATVSPNYLILMSSRIIGAISSGIFSVSSVALAAKIVPSSQVGKAIGRTMMGYTASLVLGVPFGTFVGETFGWRIIFALVALVSLLPLAGVWLFVQKVEGEEPVPLKTQFSIMRNPAMVMGMLVTVFILIGQFCLYTYLTPFLHALADFHTKGITASFFVLGIFGVLGSFIAEISLINWVPERRRME